MYKIKILTPVHVGGSAEKNMFKGLDFISKKNRVFILDSNKLSKKFSPEILASAAAKKDGIEELVNNRRIKYEDLASKIYQSKFLDGFEIKGQIKNGFGKPYLPGSSLKGSFRSMLVHHYQTKNSYSELREYSILGDIENSILKFLQIDDCYFRKESIYNSAIMSLIGEDEGWKMGWKSENVRRFNGRGMTTLYETLAPGDHSEIEIKFKSDLLNSLSRTKIPRNFPELLSDQFDQSLFKVIREYTKTHLEREVYFVKEYFNESKDQVLKVLNWLIELNDYENSAVLRLGAGSGFHSITGDWQFTDHTNTGYYNQGRHRGKKKYKTRKYAFTYHDRYFRFWPMGFILLSRKNVEVKYPSGLIQENIAVKSKGKSRLHQKNLAEKQIEIPKKVPKQEIVSKIENKKFKTGEIINAVGTGRTQGRMNAIVHLLIEGYENKDYPIRYPAGIEKGIFVKIRITNVTKKGVIDQVVFQSFL